jgi:hypothetical protein
VVRSEAVFSVTDLPRLREAAQAAITARDYGDGPAGKRERTEDLARAAVDVAAAALELADPGLVVPDGCGVAERSSVAGAEACDEEGRAPKRLPDFAGLFEICDCGRTDCNRCDGFQLTPRTAAMLYVNAQASADAAYDDVDSHGDEPVTRDTDWAVFDAYPPITFRQDAVWRRQAARAFDDLADDLDGGRSPEPRCPAEEMALRLILAAAQAMLADMAEYVADLVAGLPEHPDDYDWALVFESLLQELRHATQRDCLPAS